MAEPPDLSPIKDLLDLIVEELDPDAIWLFGSRARGTARPDSDWDLLVVVPDEREAAGVLDPMVGWTLRKRSGVRADIITCTALGACRRRRPTWTSRPSRWKRRCRPSPPDWMWI